MLDRAGKAAAAGEDAAVVKSVVEVLVRQGGDVDIARIKQGLQLLKGDNTVDIGADGFPFLLHFFGDAGADENDLAARIEALNVLCNLRHGGEVVRNVLCKVREGLADIGDEGRAAGAG